MRALGIDPGTRRAGYAVVEEIGDKLRLLDAGILRANAAQNKDLLNQLSTETKKICDTWQPEIIGIERLYFAKNQKTAIAVAQGRGAILAAAAACNAHIFEFSPNEIKLQIAGHGHADKKAITKMVQLILGRADIKLIDDAMDAAAIALTALRQKKLFS